MNTKVFTLLLLSFLVLGGSLGGAFAGGMALGKSQGENATTNGLPVQPTSSLSQSSLERSSQVELGQFRQRFQGQVSPDGGQGFAGRGGLTGTIENIEGDTITVNTSRGPLQAIIGADTIIQMFAEGTLADLQTGQRVTVTGQPDEDGTVQAGSILLMPEGAGGFFFGDD